MEIHGSLKHTLNREKLAKNALQAAVDSADNIVSGICNAIIKAEQNTVIPAKVDESELAKLRKYVDCQISKDKELLAQHQKLLNGMLENHRIELAKHLRNSEGIWLSDRWVKVLFTVYVICVSIMVFWLYYT